MIDIDELCFSAANSVRDLALLPSEVLELISRIETAERERDDVAQQLVQSEISKREISEAHNAVTRRLSALAGENIALSAKIEAMEQQKPVAWRWELKAGQYTYIDKPEHAGKKARIVPLYTLSGAQTQGE